MRRGGPGPSASCGFGGLLRGFRLGAFGAGSPALPALSLPGSERPFQVIRDPSPKGFDQSHAAPAGLPVSPGADHQGHDDEVKVQEERPVSDIPQIVAKLDIPGDIPGQEQLRHARETRLYRAALLEAFVLRDVPRSIVSRFDLHRPQGPRSDEAHFALEDVQQLRQLIQGEGAKHPAERRDPIVLGRRLYRAHSRLGVLAHGPELEAGEEPSPPPHALLGIEDGPAGLRRHGCGHNEPAPGARARARTGKAGCRKRAWRSGTSRTSRSLGPGADPGGRAMIPRQPSSNLE